MWAGRPELQYFGKIKIQKRPALFQNLQSFINCWMERSIRYHFFIDLESIQHMFSFDYSLNICFSRPFLYSDRPSFFCTNPYKMSIFEWSVTCSFFSGIVHILTRNQGKNFENMFLVKIASKGTSLNASDQIFDILLRSHKNNWKKSMMYR